MLCGVRLIGQLHISEQGGVLEQPAAALSHGGNVVHAGRAQEFHSHIVLGERLYSLFGGNNFLMI